MFRSTFLVAVSLVALLSLLLLTPQLYPAPPTAADNPVLTSVHLQITYRVVTVQGMTGYEVLTVPADPEAGRMDAMMPRLQVGEILLTVGNYPAGADDPLDGLINLAYDEDNRVFLVLDQATGLTRWLEF